MLYSVGRGVLFGYCVIVVLNIVVLALSARVNHFQDYFYIADVFPLALSAVTFGIAVLAFLLDIGLQNSPTARPSFEIAVLLILSIFWLACNVFSTSRWRHIPLDCSTIPTDYPDVRSWCRDLQALKAFVWINWVVLFIAALVALQFSVKQHQKGQKHIWHTPLSRFKPRGTHERSSTIGSKLEDFLRFSR
ncbi:hypothetical protein EDB84DRAFT_1589115 [Lactarius hengduanensis]|nr:hypothetical protein EDB84DRAFT_1589115 [Lactarius hengduanensis]